MLVDLLATLQLQIDHAAFARSRYKSELDPNWGQVARIPVDELRHLLNPARFVGAAHEARFKSLIELFDAGGAAAVPPIFIHWCGSFFLTDGHHRLQIAIERGLEHLNAIFTKGRPLQ